MGTGRTHTSEDTMKIIGYADLAWGENLCRACGGKREEERRAHLAANGLDEDDTDLWPILDGIDEVPDRLRCDACGAVMLERLPPSEEGWWLWAPVIDDLGL